MFVFLKSRGSREPKKLKDCIHTPKNNDKIQSRALIVRDSAVIKASVRAVLLDRGSDFGRGTNARRDSPDDFGPSKKIAEWPLENANREKSPKP